MQAQSWKQANLDLAASKNLASKLALEIKNSKTNWILFFEAEMGAGKTTFIREFGKALGIKANITSPSFVGMNEYKIDGLAFYHLDLYQVNPNIEDLAELIENTKEQIIVAIEWAEKFTDSQKTLFKDMDSINIRISTVTDDERLFQIQSHPLLSKLGLQ